MPVWLDDIPEKAVRVCRPNTRRWLLFLALLLPSGVALTLWNWTAERSGFAFWFTAVGLPFCCWGLIFSLRRFAYKANQVATAAYDAAREELIEREIHRGQRCAWILTTSVQTAAGNSPAELLAALDMSTPLIRLTQPRGSISAVRYSALTAFQSGFDPQLNAILSKLALRIKDVVELLPQDFVCGWMLDCDGDLYHRVETQLTAELAEQTGRTFRLMAGKGLAAVDSWLDKQMDSPGIMLAIALSLPAEPREGDADAIAMMVLSNRQIHTFPDAEILHRPEKGTAVTLQKTLSRALLWANLQPLALCGSWSGGPQLEKEGDWNKACEHLGVGFNLVKGNCCLDPLLGYSGHASPWLTIALADLTVGQRGPQVIAVQPAADQDDIWVSIITQHQEPKG